MIDKILNLKTKRGSDESEIWPFQNDQLSWSIDIENRLQVS